MAGKNELAVVLKNQLPTIKKLAGRYVNPDRMMAVMLEAVKNPKLAACTQESIIASFVKMADLGTDRVGPGGVWLVPYKDTMSVIPDWRLMVNKAKEAKAITHATAEVVHEGDIFDYERGLEPKLVHKPAGKPGAKATHAYCAYTLPDGTRDFLVMTIAEIEKIRGRSAAWKGYLKYKTDCPWNTDPEEMDKKTVIKRTLKIFEGASSGLSKVMAADNEVLGYGDIQEEPIAEPQAIDATAETVTTKEEFDAGQPAQIEETKEPATDKEKQEQIFNWCLEMAEGNPEEAEKKIESLSAFVKKDKETKKVIENVPGVKNPYDLKGMRLKISFDRVKKAYDAWKKNK
jgi:phage RecT family recombinase